MITEFHTGTYPWVPSGGPRGAILEPYSRPKSLREQLPVQCSLASVSHRTLYALAPCTVWTCGLSKKCLGNIFSEYLDKGCLPSRAQKTRCESLWGQTELVYKNISPQVIFKLWVSICSIRVMFSTLFECQSNRDRALGAVLGRTFRGTQ